MLWRHWRQNVLKESETSILICLLFPTLALNYCFLRKGDVALLNCTAIVNTSNESLTDKNPVSESIFMLAGPDLKEDLQKLRGKWTFLGLLVLRKHIFWCLKKYSVILSRFSSIGVVQLQPLINPQCVRNWMLRLLLSKTLSCSWILKWQLS